jgi:hypothetical protein
MANFFDRIFRRKVSLAKISEPMESQSLGTQIFAQLPANMVATNHLRSLQQYGEYWHSITPRLWALARDSARDAERPYRWMLIQIYRQILDADVWLTGLVQTRKKCVMATPVIIVNARTGVENKELTRLIQKEWFRRMCMHLLDADYYGGSVVQLTNLQLLDNGRVTVAQVPFENLDPVRGYLLPNPTAIEGVNYRSGKAMANLIELRSANTMGLFLPASLQCTEKLAANMEWGLFIKVFYQWLKIIQVASPENAANLQRAQEALANAETSGGIISKLDDFKAHKVADATSYAAFKERIAQTNQELTGLIFGISPASGTSGDYVKSRLAGDVFDIIIENERRNLIETINEQVLNLWPVFNNHVAKFEHYEKLTPTERITIYKELPETIKSSPEIIKDWLKIPSF